MRSGHAGVSVVRYVYAFRNYFVRVSTAVWYDIKCGVTSLDTSTGLLRPLQASNRRVIYQKKRKERKNFPGVALCQPHLYKHYSYQQRTLGDSVLIGVRECPGSHRRVPVRVLLSFPTLWVLVSGRRWLKMETTVCRHHG